MKPIKTEWKNISVRGWQCAKCNEELIHPVDAQKAFEIEQARKKNKLKVKLRKVGKSSVVTVPQAIMETKNLRDGQEMEWKLEGKNLILSH